MVHGCCVFFFFFFFFNDTATTEIYTRKDTLSYTTLFRSRLVPERVVRHPLQLPGRSVAVHSVDAGVHAAHDRGDHLLLGAGELAGRHRPLHRASVRAAERRIPRHHTAHRRRLGEVVVEPRPRELEHLLRRLGVLGGVAEPHRRRHRHPPHSQTRLASRLRLVLLPPWTSQRPGQPSTTQSARSARVATSRPTARVTSGSRSPNRRASSRSLLKIAPRM